MNQLLKLGFERSGYTYEYLKDIMTARYQNCLFLDEDKLILELKKACDEKKHIVVLPDFDMDGISAGDILYTGGSLLGFNIDLYAPDVNNGYGFTADDIVNITKLWPDVDIILTCDVGITCFEGIDKAHELGIKVFVTDHHIEGLNNRTNADIIVDPSRYDETCEFKGVCGAYVAYHLISSYARCINNPAITSLVEHLSLAVSFGSFGDLMPLLYDTRLLVIQGIKEFNTLLDCENLEDYFHCSLDLLPECYVAFFENIKKMHYRLLHFERVKAGEIVADTYGFTYCPMFNSVKRMGDSIDKLYALLYKRYAWGDDKFSELVDWLWNLNEERKALVQYYFDKLMLDFDQPYAPYVYVTDARSGILGLLAMKIMGCTGSPCLVVNEFEDCFAGSGRLPVWADPMILRQDKVIVAGHSHAFGITIDKSVIVPFVVNIGNYVKNFDFSELEAIEDNRVTICFNSKDFDYSTIIKCDFGIDSKNDYDVCVDYVYEVGKLAPFGSGFAEPIFKLFFRKSDVVSFDMMGKHNDHCFASLRKQDRGYQEGFDDFIPTIKIVDFNDTSFYENLKNMSDKDVIGIVGRFSMNEYRGSTILQFLMSGQIC